MKPVHWIFLLCLVVYVGCTYYHNDSRVADCDADTSASMLQFTNNVLVHLNKSTSIDYGAFVTSKQTKTILTDPHGLAWELETHSHVNTQNLTANGFKEDWFLTPQNKYQHYFSKFFERVSAPPEDPMVDGPAMCSLFLEAGEGWYVWLHRNADLVACPTNTDYHSWLPSASMFHP